VETTATQGKLLADDSLGGERQIMQLSMFLLAGDKK
jgi:hypothetical protein